MNQPKIVEVLAYYYNNPLAFVKEIIQANPSEQETQVLMALQNHKLISAKSGHGIGKTTLQAWVILWFMHTRPYCKIPCTAPTQHQLYDVLWSELSKWHGRMPSKDEWIWTQTHFVHKYNPETWFAVARSSSKPENMQGYHADELLFIIDEASGVAQEIFEVIEGALTNEGAYCLMMGNPTQVSGAFFNSFHKDRHLWKTFTFSSLDSPFVSKEYSERMKDKYGIDSNIYKVRVLGEFPDVSDDTLISLSSVEKAIINNLSINDKDDVHVGVDVARFGNDKTVILLRQGNKVLKMSKHSQKSTMETTGLIMMELNKFVNKCKVYIKIDDTGVGGGVTDRLRELLRYTKDVFVEGVNNGSKAINEKEYVNLGTELWFNMKENISEWDIPDDEELVGQLTSRKYKISSNGKLSLEKKEDMKERGLQSPDCADALSLAFKQSIIKGGVIIDF